MTRSKSNDSEPTALEKRRLSSEIFKNYLGAAAVIVAGLWAVFLFCQKELPRLRPKVGASISIAWQKIAGRCVADVTLNITNDSGSFVDVHDVKLEGWNYSNSVYANDGQYFSPERLTKENSKSLFVPPCSVEKPCSLVGPYAPAAQRYETFTWSFEPDPSRLIFIKATIEAENRTFIAGNGSTMCGENAQ